MECDGHIKDLLPDYHLGQLPPEEAEVVRLHLAEHPACQDALEEVAEVLDLMPFAVPPAAPPTTLRERIVATASGLEAPRPAAEEREERPPIRRREVRWGTLLPLTAAAAVLIFLSVFAWSAYLSTERENERLRAEVERLQAGSGGDLVVVNVESTNRAPGARGTAVLDPTDGAVALDVYNLPSPPQGHSYRAWLLGPDKEFYALGTMETDGQGDGRMAGRLPEGPGPYDAVQVTTEPVGAEERAGPVYLHGSL